MWGLSRRNLAKAVPNEGRGDCYKKEDTPEADVKVVFIPCARLKNRLTCKGLYRIMPACQDSSIIATCEL